MLNTKITSTEMLLGGGYSDYCFHALHSLPVQDHFFIRIQQQLIQRPQQVRIVQEAAAVDFNFRQRVLHERQACADGAVLSADFFGDDRLGADSAADDDLLEVKDSLDVADHVGDFPGEGFENRIDARVILVDRFEGNCPVLRVLGSQFQVHLFDQSDSRTGHAVHILKGWLAGLLHHEAQFAGLEIFALIELAFKDQPAADAGPKHKRQPVLDARKIPEPQFGQGSGFSVIDDRKRHTKFRLKFLDEGNAVQKWQCSPE